jgi:CheY-like chemotaxis protein
MANLNRRALLVDDDHIIQVAHKLLVCRLGFEVELAYSGTQALSLLNDSFCLILLDINMPGMNGIETAKRIKQQLADKSPLMIAVTGHSEAELKEQCLAAGISAVLTKPLLVNELEQALSTL